VARRQTKKIALELDARVYAQLSKLAKENGQSRRFLLERALEHYIQFVVREPFGLRSWLISGALPEKP
jgi:predicted transcriptional regulator